jgi:hypothetical protein
LPGYINRTAKEGIGSPLVPVSVQLKKLANCSEYHHSKQKLTEYDKLIFFPGVLAILKSTTMENNNQNQPEREEVPNLEQFQVGRNPENDQQQEQQSQDDSGNSQENGYTSGETEFADGEDSNLDQELGPDDDLDNDDQDDDEEGEAGDDADFDNPDDDPA